VDVIEYKRHIQHYT